MLKWPKEERQILVVKHRKQKIDTIHKGQYNDITTALYHVIAYEPINWFKLVTLNSNEKNLLKHT